MEREVVLKLWVGYRLLEKGIKKKNPARQRKVGKDTEVECVWKVSSSVVHLGVWRHDQRSLSEMHYAVFFCMDC